MHYGPRHMIPIQCGTHNTTGIASALAAGIQQIVGHGYIAHTVPLNAHRSRGSCLHSGEQSANIRIDCKLFAKANDALAQRIRNIAGQYLIQRTGRQARSVRPLHKAR